MTSVSEAIDVMTAVVACHQRTAPRMDDEQATRATATVWAELFSPYNLTAAELVDAVKTRAEICPDAPDPADIIRIARAKRNDQMGRAPTEPDPEDEYGSRYPGDAKAGADPADYPQEWDSELRLNAYWCALRMHVTPHTTAGWIAFMEQVDANTRPIGHGELS